MGFPNVPLGGADWQRKASQAINHLLNQITFFQFTVADQPDAAESIILTQFPVPVPLVASQCMGWAGTAPASDAVFTLNVGGSSAGTYTFPAGQQDAVIALTVSQIPADTDFEIVAPASQDASLADITITIAASI